MQRRLFLKSSGLTFFTAASGLAPSFMSLAAQAAGASNSNKTLVVVFQRFGMDGLMAVTPYADPHLAKLRPDLMLSPPGSGKDNARIDLDGQYGLHPSLAPLEPLFREGSLAIVQAAGSPHNTRSHSEAQLWWESGAPGDRRVSDGWLNRAIGLAPFSDATLQAVSVTSERPRVFYGQQRVASVRDLEGLTLALPNTSGDNSQTTLKELKALYKSHDNEALRRAGLSSLEVSHLVKQVNASSGDTKSATDYPQGSEFGHSLHQIAQLIKGDMGLQIAFAESRSTPDGKGSWDSHSNEAALDGPLASIARDFSHSVAAFWNDLGKKREDVILVTMTDFGRNVVQNEAVGSDHGRATATLVLGGSVKGGHVYGTLPERFDRDALEDQMDLPVTTDFRSIMSTLTQHQLGIRDHQRVFPGWHGDVMPIVRA